MLAISSKGDILVQCVWYWNNSRQEADFIIDQNWMSFR